MNVSYKMRPVVFILILAMILSNFTFVYGNNVSDGDYSLHWAHPQISKFVKDGIMNGYEDGSFKPDNRISRAEFVTIINKTFGYTEMAEDGFVDVTDDAWYKNEVLKAKLAGYVSGYLDDTFKPDNSISRQEAAAILSKILKLNEDETKVSDFADASSFVEWSTPYIGAVASKGFMSGYPDGTFAPEKSITRAEAVTVINNIVGTRYDQAGTYGDKDEQQVIEGNLTITSRDVILSNLLIKGDLILSAGIGDGDVTLDSVTVEGATFVNGGGENSIVFNNTTLGEVIVYKKNGKIRIVAKGSTTVGNTKIGSSVKMEEDGLDGEGFEGVEVITLKPGDTLELDGDFSDIKLSAPIQLDVTEDTEVGSLQVGENAEGSEINVGGDASIGSVQIKTETKINAEGEIGEVKVQTKADAKVELNGNIKDLTIASKSEVSIGEGTIIDTVKTTEEAEGSKIDLAGGSSVGKMTLNTKTEVKGEGEVKKAEVNADGVTFEQEVEDVELGDGVEGVNVAGQRKTTTFRSRRNTGGGGTATPTVAKVTATPNAGNVEAGTVVELSTVTSEAKIYYTLDGTTPTTTSDEYVQPIIIEADTIIKTMAIKSGYNKSIVSTYNYILGSYVGIELNYETTQNGVKEVELVKQLESLKLTGTAIANGTIGITFTAVSADNPNVSIVAYGEYEITDYENVTVSQCSLGLAQSIDSEFYVDGRTRYWIARSYSDDEHPGDDDTYGVNLGFLKQDISSETATVSIDYSDGGTGILAEDGERADAVFAVAPVPQIVELTLDGTVDKKAKLQFTFTDDVDSQSNEFEVNIGDTGSHVANRIYSEYNGFRGSSDTFDLWEIAQNSNVLTFTKDEADIDVDVLIEFEIIGLVPDSSEIDYLFNENAIVKSTSEVNIKPVPDGHEVFWSSNANLSTHGSEITYTSGTTLIDVPDSEDTYYLYLIDTNTDYINRGTYTLTVDDTDPNLSLVGINPQTIQYGNDYIELGAMATDAISGNLSNSIEIDVSNVDITTLNSSGYLVRYSVSDEAGNETIKTRFVRVVDELAPQITVISPNPQVIEFGDDYVELGATATDNYDTTVNVEVIASNVAIDTVGNYSVTYGAVDSSGNSSTTTRTVVVQDTVAPVLTFAATYTTVQATSDTEVSYKIPMQEYSDNYFDVEALIYEMDSNVNVNQVGTYQVVYTVTEPDGGDGTYGLSVSAVMTVEVVDTIAPVITLSGPAVQMILVGDTYVDLEATVEEDYDDITVITGSPISINTAVEGEHIISYDVTDSNGNVAETVTRSVIVTTDMSDVDVSVSATGIIYSSDDFEIVLEGLQDEYGVTLVGNYNVAMISDLEGPIISQSFEFDSNGDMISTIEDSFYNVGTHTISLQITSGPSVSIQKEFNVVIARDELIEYGPESLDGIEINDGIDLFVIIDDDMGHDGSSLPYDLVVIINDNIQSLQLDNVDSEEETFIGINKELFNEGENTVKVYGTTVPNSSGVINTTTAIELTIIIDSIAPIITLSGINPYDIEVLGTYEEFGATATDFRDGVPTDYTLDINIDSSSVITDDVVDNLQVIYTVSDNVGNQAEEIRVVNIVDTQAPTISISGPATMTIEYTPEGDGYTEHGVVSSDNYMLDDDGSMPNYGIFTGSDSNVGTYVITYTAIDMSGNSASAIRTIIVEDNEAPQIELNGPPVVTVLVDDVYEDYLAYVEDNYDGDWTVSGSPFTIDTSTTGAFIIEYDAADSSGNQAETVTRTVNVVDDLSAVSLILKDSGSVYPGDAISITISGLVDAYGDPLAGDYQVLIDSNKEDASWYSGTMTFDSDGLYGVYERTVHEPGVNTINVLVKIPVDGEPDKEIRNSIDVTVLRDAVINSGPSLDGEAFNDDFTLSIMIDNGDDHDNSASLLYASRIYINDQLDSTSVYIGSTEPKTITIEAVSLNEGSNDIRIDGAYINNGYNITTSAIEFSVKKDTVKPIVSSNITDGAVNIPQETQIVLTFDEALSLSSGGIIANNTSFDDNSNDIFIEFVAVEENNIDVAFIATYSSLQDGSMIVIQPNDIDGEGFGLQTGLAYEVSVAGFKDEAGNMMAPTSVGFEVEGTSIAWTNFNFMENVANDGSVTGSVIVSIVNGEFGQSPDGSYYSSENIPTGLELVMTMIDSTTAAFTLSGTAVAHDNNDVNNIIISIEQDALIDEELPNVDNTSLGSIAIDFTANEVSQTVPTGLNVNAGFGSVIIDMEIRNGLDEVIPYTSIAAMTDEERSMITIYDADGIEDDIEITFGAIAGYMGVMADRIEFLGDVGFYGDGGLDSILAGFVPFGHDTIEIDVIATDDSWNITGEALIPYMEIVSKGSMTTEASLILDYEDSYYNGLSLSTIGTVDLLPSVDADFATMMGMMVSVASIEDDYMYVGVLPIMGFDAVQSLMVEYDDETNELIFWGTSSDQDSMFVVFFMDGTTGTLTYQMANCYGDNNELNIEFTALVDEVWQDQLNNIINISFSEDMIAPLVLMTDNYSYIGSMTPIDILYVTYDAITAEAEILISGTPSQGDMLKINPLEDSGITDLYGIVMMTQIFEYTGSIWVTSMGSSMPQEVFTFYDLEGSPKSTFEVGDTFAFIYNGPPTAIDIDAGLNTLNVTINPIPPSNELGGLITLISEDTTPNGNELQIPSNGGIITFDDGVINTTTVASLSYDVSEPDFISLDIMHGSLIFEIKPEKNDDSPILMSQLMNFDLDNSLITISAIDNENNDIVFSLQDVLDANSEFLDFSGDTGVITLDGSIFNQSGVFTTGGIAQGFAFQSHDFVKLNLISSDWGESKYTEAMIPYIYMNDITTSAIDVDRLDVILSNSYDVTFSSIVEHTVLNGVEYVSEDFFTSIASSLSSGVAIGDIVYSEDSVPDGLEAFYMYPSDSGWPVDDFTVDLTSTNGIDNGFTIGISRSGDTSNPITTSMDLILFDNDTNALEMMSFDVTSEADSPVVKMVPAGMDGGMEPAYGTQLSITPQNINYTENSGDNVDFTIQLLDDSNSPVAGATYENTNIWADGTALSTQTAFSIIDDTGVITLNNSYLSSLAGDTGIMVHISNSSTDGQPVTADAIIVIVPETQNDLTPPSIDEDGFSYTDTNNNNTFDASDYVTIYFDEYVSVAGIDISNLLLSDGTWGSSVVSPESIINGYASEFTIVNQGDMSLVENAYITIAAANVVDEAGNIASDDIVITITGITFSNEPQPELIVFDSYTTDEEIVISYDAITFDDYGAKVFGVYADDTEGQLVAMIHTDDWEVSNAGIIIYISDNNPIASAGEYVLRVKATDYNELTTSDIAIVAGTAVELRSKDNAAFAPPEANGQAMSTAAIVIVDQYDNVCTGISTGNVDVDIEEDTYNKGWWNLLGTTTASIVSGEAIFDNIILESISMQGARLTFTHNGLVSYTGQVMIPEPSASPEIAGGVSVRDYSGATNSIAVSMSALGDGESYKYIVTSQPLVVGVGYNTSYTTIWAVMSEVDIIDTDGRNQYIGVAKVNASGQVIQYSESYEMATVYGDITASTGSPSNASILVEQYFDGNLISTYETEADDTGFYTINGVQDSNIWKYRIIFSKTGFIDDVKELTGSSIFSDGIISLDGYLLNNNDVYSIVKGRVVDSEATGTGIENIRVVIGNRSGVVPLEDIDEDYVVDTDSNGYYEFINVPKDNSFKIVFYRRVTLTYSPFADYVGANYEAVGVPEGYGDILQPDSNDYTWNDSENIWEVDEDFLVYPQSE